MTDLEPEAAHRGEDDRSDERARDVDEHVQKLLAAGEHAAAAEALRHHGRLLEAAEIFEQIFEHDRALDLYERAGDLRGAMRVAMEARDEVAVDRVVVRATQTGEAEGLLKMLAKGERFEEVGKIHLSGGDLAAAAEAFEQAGRWARAAACREELGDLRTAGVLYERHLEENPGEPDASLRLGRILARFSRYDDAIELMQAAVRSAHDKREMLARAAPFMVLSFLELGYRVAAESLVERWQKSGDPSAPASLDAFLNSKRAQALAAQMAAPAGHARQKKAPPEGLDAFFGGDDGEAASPSPSPSPSTGSPPAGIADDDDARGDDATMLLGGRYLLGEPLGGGGVGQVFRAYDALMDRPVAVKIFGSGAMASDAVQGYAREARAAAALEHVAVAGLVELNMAQGFVVTAFVEGDTLEERLQEGGQATWLLPAARALLDLLGSCHRVGLVHGALKPTNLFLVPGGLRVVDFGAHHLLALRSTETGGLASVWPYLAPEQLFGAPPDVVADLYAVGAILYRALTGTPPFARAEDDRRSAPEPPSRLAPALGEAWDAFFATALAPDKTQRFESAAAMVKALPPLPPGYELPRASSLSRETASSLTFNEGSRYRKGDLVHREVAGLRVYEGFDLTLERAVWIVEVDADEALAPFRACARIGRGVQPVYDVIPDERRAVLARDEVARRFDLEEARRVPQGLARDLASVASALERLHEAGYAFGKSDEARFRGPVGPRLRLAPASAPAPITEEAAAADWAAFEAFVDEAFATEGGDPDPRARLIATLEQGRALDRADAAELSSAALLGGDTSWRAFLEAVAERLVKSARGRVIARLAVSVLKG